VPSDIPVSIDGGTGHARSGFVEQGPAQQGLNFARIPVREYIVRFKGCGRAVWVYRVIW
jgi:hypothetical protein